MSRLRTVAGSSTRDSSNNHANHIDIEEEEYSLLRDPSSQQRQSQRQQQDAESTSTSTSSPAFDLNQHRQRLTVVIALVVLIVLYASRQNWGPRVPEFRLAPSRAEIQSRPPKHNYPVVPDSPVPGTTDSSVPVRMDGDDASQTFFLANGVEFTIFVPAKLLTESISSISHSNSFYHACPLVVILQNPSQPDDIRQWHTLTNELGWIGVRIDVPTIEKREGDWLRLNQSVTDITNVLDSVLGNVIDRPDSSLPSLSRVIDRSRILLTAYGEAGHVFLSFLLQRPNYWTAIAARSVMFDANYLGQVLRPTTTRLATRSHQTKAWAIQPHVAPRPSHEQSPEYLSELFWTDYFQLRDVLFQTDEYIDPDIKEQSLELEHIMRTEYGIRRMSHQVTPAATAISHIEVVVEWWSRQQ